MSSRSELVDGEGSESSSSSMSSSEGGEGEMCGGDEVSEDVLGCTML